MRRLFIMGHLNYDLKATFGVANQTFANAQVLDKAAEGVEIGSLIVVKTGGGGSSVKVVDGELELVGDGNWGATGVVSQAFTRDFGKALFSSMELPNAVQNAAVGWKKSQDVNLAGGGGDRWTTLVSNDTITVNFETKTAIIVGVAVDATKYNFMLVLGGYDTNGIPFKSGDTVANFKFGVSYWIKGGTFTNWTLLWKDPAQNTTTMYASFAVSTATATFDNILIPTQPLNVATMFDPAYLDTTPDTSVNDITISDGIIDTNVTFPGSGTETFQIRFRYQDSNNFWNVKAVAGTGGTDLTLHKTKTAGGEGAAVATSDVDFSTSTAYDIRIICRGSTWFRVYVDGALELEYNGPDTDFEDETEVQLVNGGAAFTINTFAAHRSTYSKWDAEIARATGDDY